MEGKKREKSETERLEKPAEIEEDSESHGGGRKREKEKRTRTGRKERERERCFSSKGEEGAFCAAFARSSLLGEAAQRDAPS